MSGQCTDDTERNEPVEIQPGTGLRVIVDGTVYGTKCVHPLDRGESVHDNSDDATDIELQASPNGGIKERDHPTVELQFVSEDHRQAVAATTPPEESDHEHIEITVDGKPWHVSYNGEYDATHAVAGALLAGAEKVVVERKGGDRDAE